MTPDIEKAANTHVASLFGDDLKLNPEIARALQLMYTFGRMDTLDMLGLEEADLPTGEGPIAWSA